MRVLMVCPQFHPVLGGYETLARTLAVGLHTSGVGCTVVTRRLDPAWPRSETLDGVTVRRVRSVHRRGLDGPTWSAALANYLIRNRGQFDLVHIHDLGWPIVVATALGGALNFPVVVHPHAGSGATVARVRKLWSAPLVTGALRRCAAAVAFSTEMADQLIALGYPADRIQAIPNMIDTARFTPAPQLPATPDALFVGRLSPEKGVDVLLRAWPLVRAHLPAATLTIAGDGPERAALETLAQQLGIASSVRFLGAVRDELPACYRAASAFVLASRREGVPIALLEALAAGLPVVTSDPPSVAEIVRAADAGSVVPAEDHAALGAALTALLRRPDRAALGQSGRRFVAARYGQTEVLRQYVALYHQLLAARPTLREA